MTHQQEAADLKVRGIQQADAQRVWIFDTAVGGVRKFAWYLILLVNFNFSERSPEDLKVMTSLYTAMGPTDVLGNYITWDSLIFKYLRGILRDVELWVLGHKESAMNPFEINWDFILTVISSGAKYSDLQYTVRDEDSLRYHALPSLMLCLGCNPPVLPYECDDTIAVQYLNQTILLRADFLCLLCSKKIRITDNPQFPAKSPMREFATTRRALQKQLDSHAQDLGHELEQCKDPINHADAYELRSAKLQRVILRSVYHDKMEKIRTVMDALPADLYVEQGEDTEALFGDIKNAA